MGKVIKYIHHNTMVSVDEDLMGKNKEHCLCFRCKHFTPEDRDHNCSVANLLFDVCVCASLVTPVYECPDFEEKE